MIMMDISIPYLNHDIFRSCYTNDDVIATILCINYIFVPNHLDIYSTLRDEKMTVLNFHDANSVTIGLIIESDGVCECHISMFDFVISHFHVAKGKHLYPFLTPQSGLDINIIINKHLIKNLEILNVNKFDNDILSQYFDERATLLDHFIIKISEFGVTLMFHINCDCEICVSFYPSDDIHEYGQYLIENVSLAQMHPSIKMSKIDAICRRLILFCRTVLIKDVLTHIGTIMLAIV